MTQEGGQNVFGTILVGSRETALEYVKALHEPFGVPIIALSAPACPRRGFLSGCETKVMRRMKSKCIKAPVRFAVFLGDIMDWTALTVHPRLLLEWIDWLHTTNTHVINVYAYVDPLGKRDIPYAFCRSGRLDRLVELK